MYPQIDDRTPDRRADAINKVLDAAELEISEYRRREVSTFRDLAIVQAVITWGAGQLSLTREVLALTRFLAAGACICATVVGWMLINIFRNRIHYVRDARAKLHRRLFEILETDGVQISYPTENKTWDELPLAEKYRTQPSSTVYRWALIVVCGIASLTNLLDGLWGLGVSFHFMAVK